MAGGNKSKGNKMNTGTYIKAVKPKKETIMLKMTKEIKEDIHEVNPGLSLAIKVTTGKKYTDFTTMESVYQGKEVLGHKTWFGMSYLVLKNN